MYAKFDIVEGQCGIGKMSHFKSDGEAKLKYDKYRTYEEIYNLTEIKAGLKASNHCGGTGMFGSGFVNNQVCREMYATLCKHYHLIFQTPVRTNVNSWNHFFYAMFDDKKNDDVAYIQPKWPFK